MEFFKPRSQNENLRVYAKLGDLIEYMGVLKSHPAFRFLLLYNFPYASYTNGDVNCRSSKD